jgi:hypothetical protein
MERNDAGKLMRLSPMGPGMLEESRTLDLLLPKPLSPAELVNCREVVLQIDAELRLALGLRGAPL